MISFLCQTLQLYMVRSTRKFSAFKRKDYKQFYTTWKELFANVLMQPNDTPKETWESMRKYVMESKLKPLIVDSYILQMCKQEKYPDVGICYYKFLESNNYNPSVTTIGLYLELYDLKEDPITTADRDHILKLYNYITSQYQSLDCSMSNILVIALCKIDRWQDAIKIIKEFEATDKQFLRDGYSALISYLFNSGKIELANEYLIASLKTGIGPLSHTYSAYIEYCLKEKHKFKERMEILFNLWSKYGIKPSEEVVHKFITICNNIGWSAKLTTISRSKCCVCRKSLVQTDLTQEEYKLLSKAVLQKLILKHIYYVTNPHEINNYMKFIDARKPYDIVIDGLNIMYSVHFGFNALKNYLVYYKNNNKKTLVIGRHHMQRKAKIQNMRNLADFFFVHNWSQDDVFILYAAFSSGPNTVIISNDFMRQHKYALNDVELDTLFKKWQALHQYTIKSTEICPTVSGEPCIDSIVQKQDNCWHIPYLPDCVTSRKRHTSTSDWACFDTCPQ
ncbi:mitochondrial ribonuclease P catalytic subunit [Xylocopa sonorina]|uniref:mitochondrial ribonuclease P catalytic subunit n=1 Tax=Xylocopa sonorina TaxID=1818115 RepID=UPI00403ADEDB